MNNESKLVKAVAKLNELTQTRALQWTKDLDVEEVTRGTDDVVHCIYKANWNGRRLRLYEYKYRDEETHHGWDSNAALEIVDDRGISEFRFPSSIGAWHLLNSVKYQTSNVESFLDGLV